MQASAVVTWSPRANGPGAAGSIAGCVDEPCGDVINPDDPGVAVGRDWERDGEWVGSSVPWIADLRGGPSRLMPPACVARDRSVEDLVAVVTEWEKRQRGR